MAAGPTAAEQQEGAGYLVGDEVCALFAGALTFREQCVAAGILYKDLDSEGDSTTLGVERVREGGQGQGQRSPRRARTRD